MAEVYLALYKGKKDGKGLKILLARFQDWLVRKLTRGKYSHCEIAVKSSGGQYRCFSSSKREGGVREKVMSLPPEKWDLIPVPDHVALYAEKLYGETKSSKYDYMGVIGFCLGVKHHEKRWFCSEWCGSALNINEAWRFSPNDLTAILNQKHSGVYDVHRSKKP